MKELIDNAKVEIQHGRNCVLATIVASSGSVPRSVGSRMLVGESGLLCGTIGGGAIEKASVEHALALLREKRSDVREFALHTDAPSAIGMICGGDATVQFQYIESTDPVWHEFISFLSDRVGQFLPTQLVLYFDGAIPSVLDECGKLLCGSPVTPQKKCWTSNIRHPHRAVIFGAGHIANALCPLLKSVGFRPIVFDNRPEYATVSRFPTAENVICGDFEHTSDKLAVQPDDFIVIMTSGHAHDAAVELQMHREKIAYLGVVGSRSKRAAVREKLKNAGITDAQLDAVYTPIGAAIRAVTPEEIAVSIAAEMIRVRAEIRDAEVGQAAVPCPV